MQAYYTDKNVWCRVRSKGTITASEDLMENFIFNTLLILNRNQIVEDFTD